MDSVHIEFIGEEELIPIIPNFKFDPIHLISGSIGPFVPGVPVRVPLWLGLNLRSQQKCRFATPDWMDIDTLDDIKEQEKQSKFFLKLPCNNYLSITKLILSVAPEDIPKSLQIRTIIRDLHDARIAKLRISIDNYTKKETLKFDNLSVFEVFSVRPYLIHSLDLISRLLPYGGVGDDDIIFSQNSTQTMLSPINDSNY